MIPNAIHAEENHVINEEKEKRSREMKGLLKSVTNSIKIPVRIDP
jgi:hypothetical protein